MKRLLFLLANIVHTFAHAQSGTYSITYYPNGDSVVNADQVTDTIIMCSNWTGVGRFENGLKEGFWQYFCNNVPMYSGTYRSGKKEGKWQMNWSGFFHYKNDLLDGEVVFYHVGKFVIEQRRFYREGKADGDWFVYDLNGTIMETRHYKMSIPVGHWIINDGQCISSGDVNEHGYTGSWITRRNDTIVGGGLYVDGLQEGAWIDVLGYVRYSGLYRKGQKQGRWLTIIGEQLYQSTEYKDGLRHGNDTIWTSGQISSIYQWQENNCTGTCIRYYLNGQIKNKYVYQTGGKIGYSEYSVNGNPVAIGMLELNPDYLIMKNNAPGLCRIAVPNEYEFELMERGVCFYHCVVMNHEQPAISVDSVARYLISRQYSSDTAGPRKPIGTPTFIRVGTWSFYDSIGQKTSEGEYLPIALGNEFFGEVTYPKTGWWSVYGQKETILRREFYENGVLKETR